MASTRIADLLSEGMKALGAAGIGHAAREARLLLGIAAQLTPAMMIGFPERTVTEDAAAAYRALIGRRSRREPVSHIVGIREFWSLPFIVNRDVLDPRPDSEVLVECVLDELPDRGAALRILDLGTGSGCLLLALLGELPRSAGWGTDLSPAALAVAACNAERLQLAGRVTLREGNWDAALAAADLAPFDVIISNPPYIPHADIAGLEPEVALHEPRLALDGGKDGFDAYRDLAPVISRHLAQGGLAALEIGLGQGNGVRGLMAAVGLACIGTGLDLGGRERCMLFRKSGIDH